MKRLIAILALILLVPAGASAADDDKSFVRLPLEEYNRLSEAARDPKKEPRPAPAEHALSKAKVEITVTEKEKRAVAAVRVQLEISILEDEWVAVPILPPGTPVDEARISGKDAQLFSNPDGVFWSTKKSGSYTMFLNYKIDALRSEAGFSLGIPVPQAAAITLSATLPGSGLDAVVIPSAGTEVSTIGSQTKVTATVPTTSGVQISWRTPDKKGHSLSRAAYDGELKDDAVFWKGTLNVQLFGNEPLTLPLLPTSTTLSDVRVDEQSAPIMVERGSFVTVIKGQGLHTVAMNFQVPVIRKDGPPRVKLEVPRIPVSRFDVSLPGKKELNVKPATTVTHKEEGGQTISTFYVAMTDQVTFSWNEAVPEEIKAEVRANASFYHMLYAEEGVLYVHASAIYNVTRGETNVLEFAVPSNVQINKISSPSGGIADWRVVAGKDGEPDLVNVFLNRELEGKMTLDIYYDRSIVDEKAKEQIHVPLLDARNVQRQRGMVALLSSKELTLKPLEEEKLTRVGENQLPAFLRQKIEKTIAHTYKYVEQSPLLVVQATKPERKQGKFDALVATLISLSDVTMKGSATVEINVKSGSIMDLQLLLPPNVNFLSLTAPSLRTHKLNTIEDQHIIDVFFTQEMEGQFRIEVAYEKIMADSEADVGVPTLAVKGAEIEQGRIAVEALSAVEVRASKHKQLSSLEPNELPQQLVLKTTNPILLAYKYVHVDPPYELALRITRHKEVDVQAATIDEALYQTLFTEDGLAVTAARFTVRNSRKQFLRVTLPEGSKVWAAFVDGKAEKPALATDPKTGKASTESPEVLIKIINSTQGFPVNLIYRTPVDKVGKFGVLDGTLPRPDMVVTKTRWNVYLPDELSYGRTDSNMKIMSEGTTVSRQAMQQEVARMAPQGGTAGAMQPLQISVPTSGVLYSFEKLYADQAEDDAYFTVAYAAGVGKGAAFVLLALGTVLFWAGLFMALPAKERKTSFGNAMFSFGGGIFLLVLLIWYLGMDYRPVVILSALLLLAAVLVVASRYLKKEEVLSVSSEDLP